MIAVPAAGARLANLLREVPLDPSADEAREWAEAELAKAIYNNEPSLWDRFLMWLGDLWARITEANTALGPIFLPLVILLVVGVIVAVVLLVGGPVRRRRLRGSEGGSFDVLDGDSRDARSLRAAADAAAAAGDHALAVLERFRAIVRSLDERAILEDRLGRTAREAAGAAGERLPACADDLHRAADLFDQVCYGHVDPTEREDAWLREVDRTVAATRPTRVRSTPADDWAAAR
ncbi:DUF4129 domain-containing protein [Occultella glacieicola]|uniref:DUF4129 domain-containing protein n=1 Tax=Occultella glacieicola TaxID=2518684 RepID=A0ABY2E683_9MICO|nr:DUF4129 domain-containing protein [Occultella glacieicola]TDE96098.1 DUF4129 domain-containing protein [Occultella glacieicola]